MHQLAQIIGRHASGKCVALEKCSGDYDRLLADELG
jgi:hypothetical protein